MTVSKIWIVAIIINLVTLGINLTNSYRMEIRNTKQIERLNFKGALAECRMDSFIQGADTDSEFAQEKLNTLKCIESIVDSGSFVDSGYEPRMFREKK